MSWVLESDQRHRMIMILDRLTKPPTRPGTIPIPLRTTLRFHIDDLSNTVNMLIRVGPTLYDVVLRAIVTCESHDATADIVAWRQKLQELSPGAISIDPGGNMQLYAA